MKIKTDANVLLEEYTYGASRQRLRKEANSQRTYYAWGGSSVLCEYTETATVPSWVKSYIYAGSRLLSTITKSGASELTEYQHPDRLGTKLITDTTLNTAKEQATLPFGNLIDAETDATSNQRFTSYDRSGATGLDYAVNRIYNSGQSRFTQVDPIGMASTNGGDPQSLNLFAYTQNNPVDFVDPTGLYVIDYASCVTVGYITTGFDTKRQQTFEIQICGTIDDNPVTQNEDKVLGGGGGGAASQKEECPVQDLTPLDDEAQRMEDGERVILDKLTEKTQKALTCLQNSIVPRGEDSWLSGPANLGRNYDSKGKETSGFYVESAFRPDSYQKHFWEILSKLNDKRINRKSCRKLKAKLIREKNDHGLRGIAAKSNSRHSSGKGFDMRIWGVSESQITKYANKCGLGRLNHIKGEETHFYLK